MQEIEDWQRSNAPPLAKATGGDFSTHTLAALAKAEQQRDLYKAMTELTEMAGGKSAMDDDEPGSEIPDSMTMDHDAVATMARRGRTAINFPPSPATCSIGRGAGENASLPHARGRNRVTTLPHPRVLSMVT